MQFSRSNLISAFPCYNQFSSTSQLFPFFLKLKHFPILKFTLRNVTAVIFCTKSNQMKLLWIRNIMNIKLVLLEDNREYDTC